MKKILHVMDSLERSGMEMMLLNSSSEWAALGYSCDVLATSGEVGPVAGQMRDRGYGVFHIPFRSRRRYLPRTDFVRAVYRLCGSGYDVVHIHSESAPTVVAVLAKLAGVRCIAVTPHNVFRYDGFLRMRKSWERRLVRLVGGRYGMISEGVRQWEAERLHNNGVRIWNWIDTMHYRPPTTEERSSARRAVGAEGDCFLTVSVGNCNQAKNHSALIESLALVRSKVALKHLHVGREERGCPERQLAQKLGLEETVCFLGSQPDPLPFLWAADAFLMPSLNEGLGLSAIEAVAAGVPLLCSRVEGLCDVAAQTRWTILTSTTPPSIADGLFALIRMEPEERRARALEDSQRIRQRFSVRNGVRSIVYGQYQDAPQSDEDECRCEDRYLRAN